MRLLPCIIFICLTSLLISLLIPLSVFAAAKNNIKPVIRTLKSASELDYPPFCLVKKDGRADGFSIDLLKAVKEGDKELLASLNEGLAVVIANGIYDDLYNKWFSPILPQPAVNMVMMAKYILLILLPVLFVLGIIGIWLLKREILLKTKKLLAQIDITERARSNLKESETYLRTVLNTLPDLVSFKDPQGIYLSCNSRFEDFFGAKEKEIIGKTDYDFVDKGLADFFRQKDKEAISKGQPSTNEEQITFSNDGHHEILETIKTPILKDDGSVMGVLGIGRNITQRKQAENLLRQERDLFDRIMESSPAGITRVDADGKLVYMNKRAEKILDIRFSKDTNISYDDPAWNITDFYGKPFLPENLPFNIVKKTGKPVYDIQHAIEWPNGGQVFLSINATPLFDNSRKFDGIVSVIDDITERYKAEQNYKMLFREMLDGFALHEIICDDSKNPINYRFIAINPAFERLTGLNGESLIGKTVLEVLPQTESYWIEKYGRVALTGEPETFESYHQQLNRYFQVTAFRYAKNQFACIFADITQQKSSEAERNRLVEAINQAGEAIVITLPDGCIQYVNPAFEEMTGYTKETVLDRPPRFLKSGVQDTLFYKNLWNTILSGNRWTGQIVNKNKNGTLYTSECSISPVKDESGNITNFIWISKDITGQIEFEKRILQSQKMESIGTLAGGIAHDFNNILFPIVGHTEMLIEDIPEDSPLQESLNEIYKSSLRARELVKQILAFSRQEKSELKLMKMQPIIKEALKLIRSTIPTTISIKQNLQPECHPVEADPTQIHQIVMNLTTNAYHAMEENGGELKVTLKEIKSGEHDFITPDMTPGSYACLTIADTGSGMDKKTIEKIFEPFFTTKEKGKGTGMGLSVVHGIVKTMNGAITVYSEPGKGTEFHIYLPIAKSFFETQDIQAKESLKGGTERVLLVDDEDSIIAVEKQALERLGYQVSSFVSSIEALDAFRSDSDKFDLIITDKAMPNMPGDKLAVELIKIRPDIPVLLCTGFSEAITEEKIQAIGIKGLLLKPIIIKDLAKKIREILD